MLQKVIGCVFRMVVFGFVTSEGKKQQSTEKSGLEDQKPLIPKSFSEQMKEVSISMGLYIFKESLL